MSLVLVRSIQHAKLIKLGEECDDEYIKWNEHVEGLEALWEEMESFETNGMLEESRKVALEANSLHAKVIEQWFIYLQARQNYIDYEVSVSGDYKSTRIGEKL